MAATHAAPCEKHG
jgi:hypothetical protein